MNTVNAKRFSWRADSKLISGFAEASEFSEADSIISQSFIIRGKRENVTMSFEAQHATEDGISAWTWAGWTCAGKFVRVTLFND